MPRADWTFLEHLLEEGEEYSTGIGRIWLTVLFLFRMLVVGTAAESAWDDEQEDFVCNTKQPGCPEVCYDKAFPISHFRYFVLQIIFVSTPTVFYFGYVALKARKIKEKDEEAAGGSKGDIVTEEDLRNVNKDNAKEKEKQGTGGNGRKADKAPYESSKLKGKFLCAYAFSILFKILLEGGFIIGLWILYDGFFMQAKFECTGYPCPHTVDCFVSRPTEKTIFIFYTQVIAAISLFLNLIELLHLLQLTITRRLEKRYRAQEYYCFPRFEQVPVRRKTPEIQTEQPQSYKTGNHVNLPVQGGAASYSNPCESHTDLSIETKWGPEEAENDLLPSYMNCMGAMAISHSPRVHYKKHAHHTGKNSKGAQKGQSKQKQYV